MSEFATRKETMSSDRHLPIIGHYRIHGSSIRVFCRDASEALDRLIDAEREEAILVTIFDRDSHTTIYTPEEIHAEAIRRATCEY